jgi:protein TonB
MISDPWYDMNGFWKAFIAFGIAVLLHSALAWGIFRATQIAPLTPIPLSGFEVVELPSSAATQHSDDVEPTVTDPVVAEPVVEDVQPERRPSIEPPLAPMPAPLPKPVVKPIVKPEVKPEAKPVPKPEIKPKPQSTASFEENNAVATQLAYIPPSQHAAYLKNPKPAYPTQARKRGMEGRVILRVFVRADGGVKSVELQQSSGYELLDRAARITVLRWRFAPATRGGHTVDGEVLIPFDFRLTSG